MKPHSRNHVILGIAAAIILIGFAFLSSGKILNLGSVFGLSAILVAKAASSLDCQKSDVAIAVLICASIVISRVWRQETVVFEACTLSFALVFIFTGLTITAVAKEKKRERLKNMSPEASEKKE